MVPFTLFARIVCRCSGLCFQLGVQRCSELWRVKCWELCILFTLTVKVRTPCWCWVAQSCPTLWAHGLQHARLPCPSPFPGACSNSCPLSRWCHPTILSHPLLLLSIFHSIRVFFNESALHITWPNYWRFSFIISHSNEHPGLISFTIDWLDLLAVQETLKSLLQHHSSKASILWHSAFFIVQLSHPYMTTGKTIALTRQTFAGKVISLPFKMLSRLVITFLPRKLSDFVPSIFPHPMCYAVLSRVRLSVIPWTAGHQVPLSMGILQARTLPWVAMRSSRDLPNPGIKPRSLSLQVDSLPSEPSGKPLPVKRMRSISSARLVELLCRDLPSSFPFYCPSSHWS